MNRPLRSQLSELYGPIVDGKWADQEKHITLLEVPGWLSAFWKYQGKPTYHMSVNRDMVPALLQAWANIRERAIAKAIITYDGCLAIRQSRADERQSVHSWGLAIDLNASNNLLGTKGNQNGVLVDCFEMAGFVWGGRWKHPDPMHFQFVTEDK